MCFFGMITHTVRFHAKTKVWYKGKVMMAQLESMHCLLGGIKHSDCSCCWMSQTITDNHTTTSLPKSLAPFYTFITPIHQSQPPPPDPWLAYTALILSGCCLGYSIYSKTNYSNTRFGLDKCVRDCTETRLIILLFYSETEHEATMYCCVCNNQTVIKESTGERTCQLVIIQNDR